MAAHKLVEAVEITNISPIGQTVNISVKPDPNSALLTQNGNISIKSKAKLLVESDRIDLQQLKHMAKNGVVIYTSVSLKQDL